jgi:hypothetical protein
MRFLLLSSTLALALAGCARTGGAANGRSNQPQATALRVVVPADDKDAELWVDGNYVGQLGEFDDPRVGLPRLAPGVHLVEVRKPGRFPVQRSVEVARDAPAETLVEAELLADPR